MLYDEVPSLISPVAFFIVEDSRIDLVDDVVETSSGGVCSAAVFTTRSMGWSGFLVAYVLENFETRPEGLGAVGSRVGWGLKSAGLETKLAVGRKAPGVWCSFLCMTQLRENGLVARIRATGFADTVVVRLRNMVYRICRLCFPQG
jgi:hypothetical protein